MSIFSELGEVAFRIQHGYWRSPTETDPDYIKWKDEMDSIKEGRSVPSDGLTDREWKMADKFAEKIKPVFGASFKQRRLPIAGDKLVDIEKILEVPWPDDIHIDPISYEKNDEEVHYISMAADGPNPGGTSHHGSMEYLPDYQDRRTMLRSAAQMALLVKRLVGHEPLILTTDDDREEHARWCMGERSDPPAGYGYEKFISDYLE